MSKKILELVMIVKNSGEVLRNCLQSIKPHIDHWTILDTGSIDNTPDIIREELKDVPGNLYFEDFVDFSTTRNRSLELSSKTCKYTLILDDSYEVFDGASLRKLLKKSSENALAMRIGSYNGNVLENYYYSLRIIKSSLNLRYFGRVHEVIDYKDFTFIENPEIFINDLEDYDHIVRSRARFRKDIGFLLQDYEENPKNPRTLYYLARTYILLREYDKAEHYFTELDNLENIDKEYKFCARYEKACIQYSDIDHDVELFNKRLLEIQRCFPERIEPLFKISIILYENQKYEECSRIVERLIKVPIPKVYITILDTTVYNYYIPYIYIDVNLKLRNPKNIEKVVPKLREMLEKYPYDQPLLNIKYSICDHSNQFDKLSNNKTLVIHTGGFVKAWDPSNETKISGSEYMAMNMCKEFRKLGYRVFMFGFFEDEKTQKDYQGIYDQIQYIDYKYFEEFSTKYVIDYLIVSRNTVNLVYYDNIKNVYLWVHDILPIINKNSPLFQIHLEKFKGVITLSNWHKNFVIQKTGIPNQLMVLSRNAIYTNRFVDNTIEKIPYRFIYMSDADRGLTHLIDMIPIIKEKYPQTTLVIYAKIEHIDDVLLKRIKELDYVSLNPRTTQENISKELLKSDVWLYPTDFTETYCISALEAMAAGCLVATVKLAGLIDTVGNRGIMCNEPITEQKNKDELLKKLFFVMDNPVVKQRYIETAKEWAFQQSYENLAKEWVKMFGQRSSNF